MASDAALPSRFELAGMKLPAFAKQLLAFLDNDGATADGGAAAGRADETRRRACDLEDV